jgi:integrase family protein with SAM-like domain
LEHPSGAVGTIYRRQVKHFTVCRVRLARTREWQECLQAGHHFITRERPIWWVKYYVNGRPQCVSSGSVKKADPKRLLQEREGDVVKGFPMIASAGKITFEEAAEDRLNEYAMNGRRSLHTARCRLRKHLAQSFGGRPLSTISTSDIRRFAAQRLAAGAAPGSINRDVVFLKRMFTLAMQAGKLVTRQHIPLKENNAALRHLSPVQFSCRAEHRRSPDE